MTAVVQAPRGTSVSAGCSGWCSSLWPCSRSLTAEIFVLRYFEGYGNREIARMLNISQGVVAVVLHRARRKLRDEIGKPIGGRS